MQLTQELQENIANSAHDMKSPACALSLAVGSLISTFHGKTRVDENGCELTMVTLIGMMQSLSALNMIINRSVVRDVVIAVVLFHNDSFHLSLSFLLCFLSS